MKKFRAISTFLALLMLASCGSTGTETSGTTASEATTSVESGGGYRVSRS